jgi:hypothetical protein
MRLWDERSRGPAGVTGLFGGAFEHDIAIPIKRSAGFCQRESQQN